jgi:hypothetical protein
MDVDQTTSHIHPHRVVPTLSKPTSSDDGLQTRERSVITPARAPASDNYL